MSSSSSSNVIEIVSDDDNTEINTFFHSCGVSELFEKCNSCDHYACPHYIKRHEIYIGETRHRVNFCSCCFERCRYCQVKVYNNNCHGCLDYICSRCQFTNINYCVLCIFKEPDRQKYIDTIIEDSKNNDKSVTVLNMIYRLFFEKKYDDIFWLLSSNLFKQQDNDNLIQYVNALVSRTISSNHLELFKHLIDNNIIKEISYAKIMHNLISDKYDMIKYLIDTKRITSIQRLYENSEYTRYNIDHNISYFYFQLFTSTIQICELICSNLTDIFLNISIKMLNELIISTCHMDDKIHDTFVWLIGKFRERLLFFDEIDHESILLEIYNIRAYLKLQYFFENGIFNINHIYNTSQIYSIENIEYDDNDVYERICFVKCNRIILNVLKRDLSLEQLCRLKVIETSADYSNVPKYIQEFFIDWIKTTQNFHPHVTNMKSKLFPNKRQRE